jgi:hypothetical protein
VIPACSGRTTPVKRGVGPTECRLFHPGEDAPACHREKRHADRSQRILRGLAEAEGIALARARTCAARRSGDAYRVRCRNQGRRLPLPRPSWSERAFANARLHPRDLPTSPILDDRERAAPASSRMPIRKGLRRAPCTERRARPRTSLCARRTIGADAARVHTWRSHRGAVPTFAHLTSSTRHSRSPSLAPPDGRLHEQRAGAATAAPDREAQRGHPR